MRDTLQYLMPAFGLRVKATTASIALALASAGCSADQEPQGELLVMLQGADPTLLRASLERHGANITHFLPIINALGARMSASQLERIKSEIPKNTRIIDDLAWEPEPELDVAEDCNLAAAIELHWQGSTASWTLFNKGDSALTVTNVLATWPPAMGAPIAVSTANTTLLPADATNTTNTTNTNEDAEPTRVSLHSKKPLTIAAQNKLTLQLEFANAPNNPGPLQRALDLEAIVNEDCGASLAPSYALPLGDSHFPAVSGASLLQSNGITGKGVTVAVLDSGLWEHPELALDTNGQARVLARYDAILGQEVEEAFDESGHGTHMTSVLARSAPVTDKSSGEKRYLGIAPDVGLVAVKAFAEDGEAGFLDIVRGIQWIVDNRERLDIRVLNLSFASRPRWPYWEDPVNQALMRAWQAGIFIAAAAGNEGPEPMTVGSPGNLPYLLTVGAITDSWTPDDRKDDYIPDFSSRGPTPTGHIKPDLVAYGGHMAGLTRPGSTLFKAFPEYRLQHGDFVMTGTSQATALISGLAALMLQLEPTLHNDELKCMLRTSTEPAIDEDGRLAYSPFTQGEGLVNIQRALTIGIRQCEQHTLDLEADIAGRDHYRGPAVYDKDTPPYLPGQSEIVSQDTPEEGPLKTGRWGIKDHLSRLAQEPVDPPIDWVSIYARERERMRVLSTEKR